MKNSRVELEKYLHIIIADLSTSRKTKTVLIDKFKNHGVLPGIVEDILKGMIILNTIPIPMLCLLTKYIYEVSGDVRLDYQNYFTEFEIEQANSYKYNNNDKEDSDFIIFENMTKDYEGDYSGVLTIQRNSEMWEQMLFRYNPETQRPLIVKETRNGTYKEPYLNIKTKNQITKRIIEGKQLPNTITINILDDGNNELIYDEQTRQVIVKGKCDLIDGYHRSIAAWFAYQKKPNSNFYFKLRIVVWDVDKAKEFIHQESLGNKLDPFKSKSYNTANAYHKIVTRINEYSKSNLQNKITTDLNDIQKNNALILFNLLFDGIKLLFPNIKDDNTKEIIETQNYIIEKLNLITSVKTELLDTKKDERLWLAYLIIIKLFENDDDIIEQINKIDEQQLLLIPYHAVNKKIINEITKIIK